MKKIIKETYRVTTTRPIAILMIVVAVFVFGVISYYRLSMNLMPDITYPSLTVRTEYEGAAPEEIETIISRPLEQTLGVVNNLVSISSISKAGFSDVILEFTWDTDMNFATQDVREKLDQVFLPLDVERPLILRYDPTLDPIMTLGIYGDMDLFTLRRIADEDIRRDLETLSGIAAVKIKGGLEEEIRVEINEEKLTVLNIGIDEVNQRLSQENINLAGGNLKEGDTEYLVRTLNEFQTLDEISNLIIGTRNGADIRIKDIGSVFKTNKEREVITRVNGNESVDIEIYKEADANIVSVAEQVRLRIFGTPTQQQFVNNLNSGEAEEADSETLKRMTNFLSFSLPEGVQIQTLTDKSVFIKSSIDEVRNTALIGGLLAIIVLYFFLRNILSTFIIGLTIPVSVIATFAPMYMFDVSLNIMSLGGLALGIGMLVDNSIVVLESIFRCREEGDSVIEAAVRGVGEVGSAVIASTLTTIAVFFPIVFVEGIAGQIFGDMALVVVFSLLASLLAALFFIPMLASRQLPDPGSGSVLNQLQSVDYLRFRAFEKLRDKLNKLNEKSSIANAAGLFLSVPVIVLLALTEILLKVVQSVSTLILLTLEGVLSLLKGLAFPIARLFKRNLSPDAGSNEDDKAVQKEHILPKGWSELFWADFLHFPSYPIFKADYVSYISWVKKRNGFLKKFLSRITFPVGALYVILRFMLHTYFSLVAKLFILIVQSILAVIFAVILMFVTVAMIVLVPSLGLFNYVYTKISAVYPAIVGGAIRNKGAVITSAGGLFVLCIMYLLPNIGQELIPELHQGEFTIELSYPIGTPLERTAEYILPIENFVRNLPDAKSVSTAIGTELNSSKSLSEEGEHTARITTLLQDGGNLIEKEERAMTAIRKELSKYSGVTAKISRPALFSFKTPIEVEIKGYNLELLQRVSYEVVSELSKIEGLTDVKSNIRRGNPEIQIIYDRTKLAKNNLNIFQVATIVRNKVKGKVATEFRDQERNIDILVRVREEDKANLENLYRMVINPGGSKPIPLSAVAAITINEGPSEIRRIDQQRSALVTANLSGVDLGSITEIIDRTLKTISKPDDFTFSITGQNKEMQTSLASLQFALIIAIFLIYVVMASQFESLIHPFVILFTIPLAIIGVIVVLYAMEISISVVVFIGLIMLAGIVVNNAIVLVDYINQLRRRGLDKVDAIITAGKVRLRPILMTTATTVLGLLPMALGLGEGAEIRTPMALTVIAGLISSTLLTLIVIPTMYAVVDRKD